MEGRRQKHLAIILARELATQLATATFIADASGELVFYNEQAELLLGRTFAEAGTMSSSEWASMFQTEDLEGDPLPLEQMPSGIALTEGRPAHGTHWIVGLDGRRRLLSVTALPLLSTPTEIVGMLALFWEAQGAEDG